MSAAPTINIDTTNDTASIYIVTDEGTYINVNSLKLGETAMMTMDQVDARVRELAREALKAAIAML